MLYTNTSTGMRVVLRADARALSAAVAADTLRRRWYVISISFSNASSTSARTASSSTRRDSATILAWKKEKKGDKIGEKQKDVAQ